MKYDAGDEKYLEQFLKTLLYDHEYATEKFLFNDTWHSIIRQLVIYGFQCQGGCFDGDSREFAEFVEGNGYIVYYDGRDKNWMHVHINKEAT